MSLSVKEQILKFKERTFAFIVYMYIIKYYNYYYVIWVIYFISLVRECVCNLVLTVHIFGRQLSLQAVLPVIMWPAFCSMRTQESAVVSKAHERNHK